MSVVFYISGHGFGHASRQIEVINAFGAARPDVEIVVRTSAPAWLFERTVKVPITWAPGECDIGVVQVDSLRLDETATLRRAGEFYRELPDRTRAEASFLARRGARFVIADAPPLACAAAGAAGVPAVVVSNFTWDWIYEDYAGHPGEAPELLSAVRDAYRQARAAWRLPMHGGFATFDTIVDVPFVARHASHERASVRASLSLPCDRPLALSSFGGYGVSGFDPSRIDCLDRYGVLLTERDEAAAAYPPGIHVVSEPAMYGAGLRYEDLVAGVDVVVTKPGYGIIAECVANGAAMLYTSRGRFVEYDVLVREMPRVLRCGFIDHAALFAGRWGQALDELLSLPAAPEAPPTNGAQVIAQMIERQLENGNWQYGRR